MDFICRNVGQVTIVPLIGRLDSMCAPELKSFMRELIAGGVSRLVLDLNALAFVDSSGLGALLAILKEAEARDGAVRLAGAPPQVARLLALTRLDHIFACFEDTEAAILSFADANQDDRRTE